MNIQHTMTWRAGKSMSTVTFWFVCLQDHPQGISRSPAPVDVWSRNSSSSNKIWLKQTYGGTLKEDTIQLNWGNIFKRLSKSVEELKGERIGPIWLDLIITQMFAHQVKKYSGLFLLVFTLSHPFFSYLLFETLHSLDPLISKVGAIKSTRLSLPSPFIIPWGWFYVPSLKEKCLSPCFLSCIWVFIHMSKISDVTVIPQHYSKVIWNSLLFFL